MSTERLQKVLARAGVAARRKAEELISAGRVRVDGKVIKELGTKVDSRKQRVEVDGRIVRPEQLCYGVLHKPRGMVTTLRDPEGRPTALDILQEVGVRVVPVGRLDYNTSGALLFTNDGDFAQALSHASGNVPKVYSAKVQKRLEEDDLAPWRRQIEIDGKLTRPADVRILRREADKTWLEVTLKEGRNRQVRRLGEHAGAPVVRLARLSHAGIDTLGLRPGQWRLLSMDELKALKQAYGVPEKLRGAMTVIDVRPARGGKAPTKNAGHARRARAAGAGPTAATPGSSPRAAGAGHGTRGGGRASAPAAGRGGGPGRSSPRGQVAERSEGRRSGPRRDDRGSGSSHRSKKRP